MAIIGYKCFDKGLINKYGKKFSVGKIYIMLGTIKFGINGNGFHIFLSFHNKCVNLC